MSVIPLASPIEPERQKRRDLAREGSYGMKPRPQIVTEALKMAG